MKKEGKMHAQNVGITKENNLISNWLKEHGDPAIDKFVKRNLAIANWIADTPYKKNEPQIWQNKSWNKALSLWSHPLSGFSLW